MGCNDGWEGLRVDRVKGASAYCVVDVSGERLERTLLV